MPAPIQVEPSPDLEHAGSDGPPPSRRLHELLLAFQSVLAAVDGLPLTLVVRSKWRRRGIVSKVQALPRPRWLLRYFIIIHVSSVLEALDRRYSSRAALGLASQADDRNRKAIQEFRQSLPPARTKILVTVLLVATVLLVQPLLETVAESLGALARGAQAVWEVSPESSPKLHAPTSATVGPETRQLLQKLEANVSSSIGADSIADAMATLTKARVRDLLLVLIGLVLTVYVILRPITSGFRLKRMMFNLYPDFERHRRMVPSRWSAERSVGIYRLESDLFKEIDARPAREIPVDVIVSALGLLPVLWVIGAIVEIAASIPDLSVLAFEYAILLLAFIGVRVRWLLTIWRQRLSMLDDVSPPFSVRIRNSAAIVEVKSPLVSGLLALFATTFSAIPQLGAIGWYRINKELRDLGYARRTDRLGHFPGLSAIAYAMGASILYAALVLAAIYDTISTEARWLCLYVLAVSWVVCSASVYGTHRRVKRALQSTGRTTKSGFFRSLAFGLAVLLAPVLLMFWVGSVYFGWLQARLNKVWSVESNPIVDPSD